MLGLDTSDLSGILEGFQGGLISGLDGVVKQFTGVEGAFTSLAATFSNLKMEHTHTGGINHLITIGNVGALTTAIETGVTDKLKELLTNELNQRLDKDFKAGQ